METMPSPTIVFCVGQTGLSIAKSLSDLVRNHLPAPPISVWEILENGGQLGVTCVGCSGDLAAIRSAAIRTDSMANAVSDVIAEVLSLGNVRVHSMMDRPISLRLSLISAVWELAPLLASELARAFQVAARKHSGSRYMTEACLVLPTLLPNSSAPIATVEEWLNALKACDGAASEGLADSFSYCWWLGRINASGLTLAKLPTSAEDIAAVIGGVITITPEQLPSTLTMLTGHPQHMSAGYAELFIPREEVVNYLVSRNATGLLDGLFLGRIGSVDQRGIRRRAWAFASSSNCEAALRHLDHTPGGERIWPGFNPGVPDEVIDGQLDNFLLSMHTGLRRFRDTEVKQILLNVESSGRSCREKLLAELEAQVQDIANHSSGGLFEVLVFLKELAAFVVETTDLSEGEEATNLQQVRRAFDRAFAEEVRLECPPALSDHASPVEQLRHQLAQLSRLRNLSAPPALAPEIGEDLRWGEEGTCISFDQRNSDVSRKLHEEIKSWAQELAAAEQWFQRARYETKPEQSRRDQEISKREDTLRLTASECRRLLLELADAPKNSWWNWFFNSRLKRILKEKNERLGYLRGVLLRQQAREVVSAYESRMQFSVDRGVYEIRDSVIQDALSKVNALYERACKTIAGLTEMREAFASVGPPTTAGILRRALLTREDLDEMVCHLGNGLLTDDEVLKSLSAWNVCCQSSTETARRLRDLAMKPFAALRGWGIEEFLRLLKPTDAKLEAQIGWLKQASRPLSPPIIQAVDYSVICAVENSQFGGMLRHNFPDAAWGDQPRTATAAVLQMRQLSTVDQLCVDFGKEAEVLNAPLHDTALSNGADLNPP